MEKTYPVIFNQNNYQDILGFPKNNENITNTETIAEGGCFDSSLAMKASYYGIQVDPPSLNQLFVKNSVYIEVSGGAKDLLPDNALSLVYPQVKYIKTLDYEPIPTDLGTIKGLLADLATTITLRINLGSGNYHFVEAVDANPDAKTLHIANPLTGVIEDFSQRYGNPVTANLHAIVYIGPIPVPVPPVVIANAPTTNPSQLATTFGQAITKANNFNTVADFFGLTADQRVTTTAGQLVVDQVKQLQVSLQQAQDQIEAFTHPGPVVVAITPPVAVGTPTFSNGTPAVASGGNIPVPTPIVPTTTAQGSDILSKIKSIFKLILW